MAVPSPHREPRRPLPPLDAAGLERLALRYVERFATTRARLATYLRRKVRERGWDGAEVDPLVVAERMAALGYVDDRGFAESRANALARRGMGTRRVTAEWRASGIGEDDVAALIDDVDARALDAASAFARRKRIGPYATVPADPDMRRRQLAAMLRAGHSLDLARRFVAMAPGAEIADTF